MDLPAPLSCFSRGFARLTSSLAKSVFCACANLCRAKNRSGHGRTGRSGCYGPAVKHNKFLFKKRIMSTFLGLMLLLLAATTSPALENNFSNGTDVLCDTDTKVSIFRQFCLCVCLSVCLSVSSYSRPTGTKPAHQRYQRL